MRGREATMPATSHRTSKKRIRLLELCRLLLINHLLPFASTLVTTRQQPTGSVIDYYSVSGRWHRGWLQNNEQHNRRQRQQRLSLNINNISLEDVNNNNNNAPRGRLRSSSTRDDDPDDLLLYQTRSTRWILLVDDEKAIRHAVGQMLLERGYHVTTCENGSEALDAALNGGGVALPPRPGNNNNNNNNNNDSSLTRQKALVPDVIVSDVRMPVMDGLALLQAIRSNDKLVQVPVVLLTAKSILPQDRVAGYNAGADAYIPKPFDPDELVVVIDSVIARHEELNDSNNLALADLKRDLQDIKQLLLLNGGGGGGGGVNNNSNGWVEATNVFLAPDERQILQLLCQGLMNKEIAERTFLSTRRVEQLLTTMYRKTNVKNRTELVRWAISTGNVKI